MFDMVKHDLKKPVGYGALQFDEFCVRQFPDLLVSKNLRVEFVSYDCLIKANV